MENDVLDALEDLGYKGPLLGDDGGPALLKAVEGDILSYDFMSLCHWLSNQLKEVCSLGESVSDIDDQETFKLEISGMLRELGCPHAQLMGTNGMANPYHRLLLLDYLTSEVQACRIMGGVGAEKMEIDEQAVSPVFQQINAILAVLELPAPTKDATVFGIFSQIENKIRGILSKVPKDYMGNPLLTKRLGEEQWSKVEKINAQLNREYSLRRQMLLKRCDVTIQSFGWSDRAKTKKDEMVATFTPARKEMAVSAPVAIADIVAARTDLLRQPRTSTGTIRERTKCAINRILMGKVPDRGGRPSTMTPPPPEMPAFKRRQDPPKDQRPHSSRGGRGGGRGGKVQGGWSGDRGGGRGGRGGWRGGGRRDGGGGNPFGGDGGQDRTVYYS
ncbi:protein FAM98A [Nematostella vectensis]|uniref:protein FAM98A n=1 Tax=Nematostella vectensis TaxID=45351 RepID=UPI0020770BED|nr:protein FAM98A [Nematostella vectensis]